MTALLILWPVIWLLLAMPVLTAFLCAGYVATQPRGHIGEYGDPSEGR